MPLTISIQADAGKARYSKFTLAYGESVEKLARFGNSRYSLGNNKNRDINLI